MTQQEILARSTTKTEKIKLLLELGLTRKEVAQLMGVGYGFVQNVFAKHFPNRVNSTERTRPTQRFSPSVFNRKFGVEIEAFGVNRAKLVRSLRAAGVAVESEGYNHTTREYWKVVNDGSLTGVDAFEVVSPILEGQTGIQELATVCRVLKECRARINKSCGLHVHFDAANFKVDQVKNLLRNYKLLENEIDSFLPESRRGNNNRYCTRINQIISEQNIETSRTIRQMAELSTGRYGKINLKAYLRHKTIEFRHHSGTIEFEKISNWISFLHNLVEYSKNELLSTVGFEPFNQAEILDYINLRQNQLAA